MLSRWLGNGLRNVILSLTNSYNKTLCLSYLFVLIAFEGSSKSRILIKKELVINVYQLSI